MQLIIKQGSTVFFSNIAINSAHVNTECQMSGKCVLMPEVRSEGTSNIPPNTVSKNKTHTYKYNFFLHTPPFWLFFINFILLQMGGHYIHRGHIKGTSNLEELLSPAPKQKCRGGLSSGEEWTFKSLSGTSTYILRWMLLNVRPVKT